MKELKIISYNSKILFFYFLLFMVYFNQLHASGKDNNIIVLPVSATLLNMRDEPGLNGKIIGQLTQGMMVVLKKKSLKKVILDGMEGSWVLVEAKIKNPDYDPNSSEWNKTFTYINREGWIFDAYVAYPEKFQKINQFNYYKLTGCIGDWCKDYEFYENGTYNSKSHDERYNEVITRGSIYRFQNIIKTIPDNKNSEAMYFFINDKGKICTSEGPPVFSLCSE